MKKVTKDKRKERINMLKEIHIHLNYKLEDYDKWTIEDNFIDTKMVINNAIQSPYNEVIHTTQPHFLSFKYFLYLLNTASLFSLASFTTSSISFFSTILTA